MYTGLTGSLRVGENPVAYISGWSIDDNSEIIEVRKIGQAHKDAYAGYQSWSASADGAASFENNGQARLFKAKQLGEKVFLKLYLKYQESGENTWFEGSGYIESLSVDISAGNIANLSISIKGVGALKLYENGQDVITGNEVQPIEEEVFTLKLDRSSGNLYAEPNGDSPFVFKFADSEEEGTLKVMVKRSR